jgi:hypothetical protein
MTSTHVRAERHNWEAVPEGRWLTPEDMRDALGRSDLLRGASDDVLDNAVSHLVPLGYP